MFTYILLDCIVKLNGERTLSNIYHLLSARKSSQTLQDRNIFNVSAYFGIYRTLKRANFDQAIQLLRDENMITVTEDQVSHITDEGYNWYLQQEKNSDLLFLNGSRFEPHATELGKTLQLFIQLVTHMHMNDYRFVPIIESTETQRFIKYIWHHNEFSTEQLLSMVYQDLYAILDTFPENHAACFVDCLTTRKFIGLNNYQLATMHQISVHEVHIIFQNIIHYICDQIQNKHTFQFIDQLYRLVPHTKDITNSAALTLNYMTKGYSIDEIAVLRQLKNNTIMDHIIEIAYVYPQLDWKPYVSEDEYLFIKQMINRAETKKLKIIKSYLPDTISYFQIKLVLALEKNNKVGE